MVHGIWSIMNVLYINKGALTESQHDQMLKLKSFYDEFCREDLSHKTMKQELKDCKRDVFILKMNNGKEQKRLKAKISRKQKEINSLKEHCKDVSKMNMFQFLWYKRNAKYINNLK